MIKSLMQFCTMDIVYIVGVVFMAIYMATTKNILDVCYLFAFSICYFRVKFYQWKKYH